MTQYVLAVVLGVLFAFGTFLVLRRDVVRVVWGVIIMGQAANVYLVTMGGISPSEVAPIVHDGGEATTDPLVQALVLTAIVIGFGTTAFALVLTYRVYEEHGTLDLDDVSAVELGRSIVPDGGAASGRPDGAAGGETAAAGDAGPSAGGTVPEDECGATTGTQLAGADSHGEPAGSRAGASGEGGDVDG